MEHGLYDSKVEIEEKVNKRKVVDLGPIMLDAERCVLCSRCLRFENEVTGTNTFEFVNRGDHTQISTFENRPDHPRLRGQPGRRLPGGRAALPRLPLQDAGLVPEVARLGLPGLLHRLQHPRGRARRRGAAPAAAPQRGREQVLDVRHRPRARTRRSPSRAASPARASRVLRSWEGVTVAAALDAVAVRIKEAGERQRVPGLAPGDQRRPLRLPRARRSRGRHARLPGGRPAGEGARALGQRAPARGPQPEHPGLPRPGAGPRGRRRHPGACRGGGEGPRAAGPRAAASARSGGRPGQGPLHRGHGHPRGPGARPRPRGAAGGLLGRGGRAPSRTTSVASSGSGARWPPRATRSRAGP